MTKPTRLRPRFSVRTLAIFVTLVCVYFGAWEATKRYGPRSISDDVLVLEEPPAPFIVRGYLLEYQPMTSLSDIRILATRRYYIWLFGPTIKLPYEEEWQ